MADLTDLQAAGTIKIVGTDLTGVETFAVDATSDGRLKVDSSLPSLFGSVSITGIGGTTAIDSHAYTTVTFQVTGTWTASLVVQGSSNNGTTWTGLQSTDASQNIVGAIASNAFLTTDIAGYTHIRFGATSFSSGTANITWNVGTGKNFVQAWNTNATSLKVAPRSDVLNSTGSTSSLNGDAIASIDVGGYSAVTIQITGTWVGTLTFQGSNDNSTFFSVIGTDVSSAISAPIATTSGNGIFFVPLLCRYFRCRMTAYTSGTATSAHTFETITSPDIQAKNVVTKASNGTLTNRSGATSGVINTSTQIMAANTSRQYLFVQNVGVNSIWINFTTAAVATQPSILLSAGASFVQEGSFISTEAINVLSASMSVPFTAKEA